MQLENSFKVTFNLKSNFHGDTIPIIYGITEELGNGDPNKGKEMTSTDGIYNYKAEIIFPHSFNSNEIWYSYCFRPAFGAIIPESIPRRYIPQLEAPAEIYDVVNKTTSIQNLLIHFHVRCHTEFGQQLYLSGNLEQLGEWDPDSSTQLFYEGNSDYWTCHVHFPLSAKSRTIEYKYFKSYSGSKTEWESSESHKLIIGAVLSPAAIEIEDTFRLPNEKLKALTLNPFVNSINKRGIYQFDSSESSSKIRSESIGENASNSQKSFGEFAAAKKPGKIYPNDAKPGCVNLRFIAFCPNVRQTQKLFLLGKCSELGEFNIDKGREMNDYYFPLWTCDIVLPRSSFPFEYKYAIVCDESQTEIHESQTEINKSKTESNKTKTEFNKEQKEFNEVQTEFGKKTFVESSIKRICSGITSNVISGEFPATSIVNDWLVNPNASLFKGFGICCPLFSLRSGESCGIGQYTDIKGLADVCAQLGGRVIRLLPVNDTTGQGEWPDSNPYRPVSLFALHPIYINLLSVVDDLPKRIYEDVRNKKWDYEQNPVVDYPTVYQYKMKTLRRIYEEVAKNRLDDDIEFSRFVDQELEWLRPYGLFCLLSAKYRTADFHKWPQHSTITMREINSECAKYSEELKFVYWVQYVCDRQFKDARKYCELHGVSLQGEFPLNVNYNSVETWAWPNYFRIGMSSGAPPNKREKQGQNWNAPSYNWDEIEEDNFHWLELRIRRMADLYHSLKIDNIVNFFRTWEIPNDSSITGTLGHFTPSNPLNKSDLDSRGLFDIERYEQPYIRWHLLVQKFGEKEASYVAATFFTPKYLDKRDDYFAFKNEFNTERKIDKALFNLFHNDLGKRNYYQYSLFELLSNVLLIRDTDNPGCYHLRANLLETSSWNELQEQAKYKMKELYEHFVYQRQNDLWISKAASKFNFLNSTSKILFCFEDYDQLSPQFIQFIRKYGFLSFKTQRYPKENNDYLSICSPSSHDMMPLRQWWEETDRYQIIDFWKNQLHNNNDHAPFSCESYILEMIINSHFASNSMFAIFLLQDLTDLIPKLIKLSPKEERINDPSDPNHHWCFRYPFSIKEILDCQEFIIKIKEIAEKNCRI